MINIHVILHEKIARNDPCDPFKLYKSNRKQKMPNQKTIFILFCERKCATDYPCDPFKLCIPNSKQKMPNQKT